MNQTDRQQLSDLIEHIQTLREYVPGQAMYSQRAMKAQLQDIIDRLQAILGEEGHDDATATG